ncbi:hypothetical protein TNCV_4891121 [Trichonephila clavipes]|nr:hypothetical protein TNCV_4891121 [Trichonephila clavipes]
MQVVMLLDVATHRVSKCPLSRLLLLHVLNGEIAYWYDLETVEDSYSLKLKRTLLKRDLRLCSCFVLDRYAIHFGKLKQMRNRTITMEDELI